MGNGSSGRLWQRVKRRDRSLGPASAVRRVEVTPEVEAGALAKLATCGPAVEAPPPWSSYQGDHWSRSAPPRSSFGSPDSKSSRSH